MSLTLVPRQKILECNAVLARHIYNWQQVAYDPSADPYVAGQSVWLDARDEQVTVLTSEVAHQLNRDFEQYCVSMKDVFSSIPDRTVHVGTVIAESASDTFLNFTKVIGSKLEGLAQAMGWSDMLVISDARLPYLKQANNYEPAVQAESYLIKTGFDRDSDDGMILSPESFHDFFSAIFWIVRCNASAPGILFTGENSSIVGMLCKYGNIHFDCYNCMEKMQLFSALASNGFTVPDDGICEEKFSATGAIEGRRLDV